MIANDTEGCCTLLIDVKFMENALRGRGGRKSQGNVSLIDNETNGKQEASHSR